MEYERERVVERKGRGGKGGLGDARFKLQKEEKVERLRREREKRKNLRESEFVRWRDRQTNKTTLDNTYIHTNT